VPITGYTHRPFTTCIRSAQCILHRSTCYRRCPTRKPPYALSPRSNIEDKPSPPPAAPTPSTLRSYLSIKVTPSRLHINSRMFMSTFHSTRSLSTTALSFLIIDRQQLLSVAPDEIFTPRNRQPSLKGPLICREIIVQLLACLRVLALLQLQPSLQAGRSLLGTAFAAS